MIKIKTLVRMDKSLLVVGRGCQLSAGTQRCFNVHITLFGRNGRQMDVVLTFCVGWADNFLLVGYFWCERFPSLHILPIEATSSLSNFNQWSSIEMIAHLTMVSSDLTNAFASSIRGRTSSKFILGCYLMKFQPWHGP